MAKEVHKVSQYCQSNVRLFIDLFSCIANYKLYANGYAFFEKLRIVTKKRKSKKRLENEEQFPNGIISLSAKLL